MFCPTTLISPFAKTSKVTLPDEDGVGLDNMLSPLVRILERLIPFVCDLSSAPFSKKTANLL
jgi:hypothetical protein